MAGGKFVSMNKVIPGAYFALQAQEPVQSALSPTGILAWVAPQNWGGEVETISLGDYARDNCYGKIGRHNSDDRMQIFSQYCNTLICVNPAKSRAAASATIRAAQADGINLYIKLGIKTDRLPDPATGLGLSASVSAGEVSLTLTTDDAEQHPIPAGYAKSLSVEELVTGNDDTYIAELYKSVSGSPINPAGMSFTSLSGTVSEAISSLTPSGGASWVGPSDAEGSLRCQRLAGALTAYAQQSGTLGNKISIVVVALQDGKKEVRTTVDGVVMDRQRLTSWSKFQPNIWIRLEGEDTFAPSPVDAINLSGGSDGVIEPDAISSGVFATNYHYVALDNNVNIDGLSLKIEVAGDVYTLSLMDGAEVVGAPVVSTGTLAHYPSFDLPNGSVLDLSVVNAEGAAVADNVDIEPAAADVTLSGGNHGVIIGLGDSLRLLADEMFNVLFVERQDAACQNAVADYIGDLSDNHGKDRRAVICLGSESASLENGYDRMELTVVGQSMDGDAPLTGYCVAAMSAGASWNEALTYAPVPLTGDPSIRLDDGQLEDWLEKGIMPISKREDGAWCITKDINSLHGDDDGVSESAKKNRCVRLVQTFRNSVKYVWETQYVGKVTNDPLGRDMFKASVCAILDTLVNGRGIAQYGQNDVVVRPGNKPDEVILEVRMTIYDSMEIVYITMSF